MLFLNKTNDALQDQAVGDFRGYARNLVSKNTDVLEIGPSYMPVFPKREGYRVRTLDHADAPTLREKYSALGVNPSEIEDVDFVWSGEALSELVGRESFNYIFASHVIEHSVDFIRFLKECDAALTESGKVLLLVPDKRYCFDLFQPITDTAKVLADYFRCARVHSFEALYREENQVSVDYDGVNRLAWWQGPVDAVKVMRSDPQGRFGTTIKTLESGEYADAHEYVFTPSSFLLLLEELRFLGLTRLGVETLTRARGCEFLVILKRTADAPKSIEQFKNVKRELSLNIMREQAEAFTQLAPLLSPLDLAGTGLE